MDYNALAELLFSEVKETPDYYEAKYPNRNLPEGAMVTRFAPSPTGFIHMGSLYTSFSDIQLAKQTNGVSYLRIEDTDQKREVENGISGIITSFEMMGINFDEGPTQGGNYGPYIQSERKEIYDCYVKELVRKGYAYPCFCTPEQLEEDHNIQEASQERLGYYGHWARCRNLSFDEIKTRIDNGEKYIIRFKSPGDFNKKFIFHDCIKGDIEFPENDLDIVLIKSDKLPLYHLAHVIDDHLMHTTHAIRGDEWVSSVPVHVQLFQVLGFKPPKYAHIAPLTIREGDSIRKLSKRKDKEAAISYYHQLGVPNDVIRLYIATVNNTNFEMWYMQNPNSTIDDFKFDFKKMPVGGSLFDLSKLMSISKIYFSRKKAVDIYNETVTYCEEYDSEFATLLKKYKDYSINVLNIEKEVARPRKDIACYSDVKKEIWYMYDELFYSNSDKYNEIDNNKNYDFTILEDYFNNYYQQNDTKEEWFNKLKEVATKYNYSADVKAYKENPDQYKGHVGDIAEMIRVAITSRLCTPDLYEILKLMTNEQLSKRIDNFKNFVCQNK